MKIVKINKSRYTSPKPNKGCYDGRQKSTKVIFDLGEKDIMGFTDYRGKSDLFDSENTNWYVVFDELTDGELKTINGNEIEKFPSKFQETKYIVLERTTKYTTFLSPNHSVKKEVE